MKKGTRFHRVPCTYCGKEIARNMIDYHTRNTCPDFARIQEEQAEQKRIERIEWAKTADISDPNLTFGDLSNTGRLEEWKRYSEILRNNE